MMMMMMMMMISGHLTHDLISLFGLCATLLTVSEELSMITWNYTYCNLQIACSKFSFKSKYTCTCMSVPLPGGDALLFESYKQPPLVGNHLIFTF